MPRFTGRIETRHGSLDLSGRTVVMGILNVTPDSFSDGGAFHDPRDAVEHALRMAADGADIIDIGGESTRPGSDPVSPDVQIRRVGPVIEELRAAEFNLPISIDTRDADVARAALDAGADFVNDVSAGVNDPRMLPLCAGRGVPVVLMHMQGEPRTMQDRPRYGDVMADVRTGLAERFDAAVAAGIDRQHIIVDPGIGFGKTAEHNWELIRRLDELHVLGRPVLVGVSRKRFLRSITAPADDSPLTQQSNSTVRSSPNSALIAAIAAAVAACCLSGIQMVRVHDVREMRAVVDVCHAIRRDTHS